MSAPTTVKPQRCLLHARRLYAPPGVTYAGDIPGVVNAAAIPLDITDWDDDALTRVVQGIIPELYVPIGDKREDAMNVIAALLAVLRQEVGDE